MIKIKSRVLPLAAALVLAGIGVQPALAQSSAPAQSSVCIQGYNIEDTERPNDNTIVLHMKDGTTYVNHTVGRCPGLANDPEGFTWSPTDSGSDEYCSNLVTIRLNTTNSVCLLGAFEKQAK